MLRLIAISYILFISSALSAPLLFESGLKKQTLVELYTSEGCSSCPPAEAFLNNLQNNKELWSKYIPVAFHVDYWDYIGWKDRYANKEFGKRQSLYANLKRTSTVYTPAFMVNGSSWRRGLFSSSLPRENVSAGNLVVSVTGKIVHATYQPIMKKSATLKLNVAVLGMGLTSHILRGENEGRNAKHEFVVVGFNSHNSNQSKKNDFKWDVTLPELHNLEAESYALAIWVSESNNPSPLQVVGGLLPGYKK